MNRQALRRKIRLGTAIAIPSALMVVAVVLLMGYLGLANINMTLDREKDSRLQAAALQADHIDQVVMETTHMIKAIASSEQLMSSQGSEIKNQILQQAIDGHQSISTITMVDNTGSPVAVLPNAGAHDLTAAGTQYVSRLLGGASQPVSDMPIRWANNAVSLMLGTAMRDSQGNITGAIVAFMDISYPSQDVITSPLKYGRTGYSALIAADGTIVASSNPVRLFQKSELASRIPSLIQMRGATIETQEDDDQPSKKEVSAIAAVPSANMILTVEQDSDEFYMPLTSVKRGFIVVGLAFLAIAVIAAILASRVLARPLSRLSLAAARIASGHLDERMPESRVYEVAQLGSSLTEMGEKLKKRIDRLRALGNVGGAINRGLQSQDVFEGLVEQLKCLFDFKRADLFMLDGEHAVLTQSTAPSGSAVSQGRRFLVSENPPLTDIAMSGTHLCAGKEAPHSPIERAMDMDGIQSCIGVALEFAGKTSGGLVLWSERAEAFTEDDLEVLRPLSAQLSVALANARLFGQIEARGREWQQTFDSMTDGIAILDTRGRVMRSNHALMEVLHKTANDVEGKPAQDAIKALGLTPNGTFLNDCLKTGLPQSMERTEPSLGDRWFHIRLEPVHDSAGHVIAAIHISRDITTEKKQRERLERIYGLSRQLSSDLNLESLMDTALTEVTKRLGNGSTTLGIALFDDCSRQLTVAACRGPGQRVLEDLSVRVEDFPPPVATALFSDRRSWMTDNLSEAPEKLKEIAGFTFYRTLIFFPLVSGDKTTGTLFVASMNPRLPEDEEVALLETYAREIGLAAENARLYTKTENALKRRVLELGGLTGILSVSAPGLDLDKMLGRVLEKATELLDADRCSVTLFETGWARIQAEYPTNGNGFEFARDRKINLSHFAWAIEGGSNARPMVLPDCDSGKDAACSLAACLGSRSVLSLPLLVRGRAIGTLNVMTKSRPKYYSETETSLGQAMAAHLSSIIDNTSLFERTEKERSTLESIISSMREGLIVTDGEGRGIYCNRSAEDLLEIRAADFVGRHQADYLDKIGLRITEPRDWKTVLGAGLLGSASRTKVDIAVQSSERRELEVTLFSISRNGTIHGAGAVLRDVTREREVDRMKTDFISVASHELRTPMTSIFGFSELLLTRSRQLPEKQRAWVQTIYDESKRLSEIVEDLLNVSRIEAGRLSLSLGPVALNPLVSGILEQLGPGHPDHTFSTEVPVDFPIVMADRSKLHQVLFNLVDNAIKYSPAGGQIKVSAQMSTDERQAIISVADRGLGVPSDEIPHLFTRFHRVHRPETAGLRGTGLGLYIVKTLVSMMGGSVSVRSKMNEGTTFVISLPIANRHEAAQDAKIEAPVTGPADSGSEG